jgi:hypothetical protein
MKTTTTAPATGLPRLGGLVLLAFLLLGPCAGPAPAARLVPAAVAAAPAPVPAEGFSLKGYFSGIGSRTRVVQLCVVAMCLALFILCRKFTAGGGW